MKKEIKGLLLEYQNDFAGIFTREDIDLDEYIDKIASLAEIIILYRENQISGFVAFYANDPKKKNSFITMIIVNKNFLGQGIGKTLLCFCENYLISKAFENISLEVRKDNHGAINLYKSIGFVIADENDLTYRMNKIISKG